MKNQLCGFRGHNLLTVAACFTLLLALPRSATPQQSNPLSGGEELSAEHYFAFINRFDEVELKEFKYSLARVIVECSENVNKPCRPGHDLLDSLFTVRRPELPDVILYLRREGTEVKSSRPVLQWHGRNTAHLYGASNIWVLAFSYEKLDLEAEIVPIYEQATNPFAGIFAVLGLGGGAQPKGPEEKKVKLSWAPITQDGSDPFYLGVARLPVGLESVNFVTLGLVPKSDAKAVSVPLPSEGEEITVTVRRSDEKARVKEEGQGEDGTLATLSARPNSSGADHTSTCDADPLESITLHPFYAISAHFSNSRASLMAFSAGFGQTLDVEDTALGQEDGTHFNAYAIAKVYLIPPKIKAFQGNGRFSQKSLPSLSLVVGTNLQDEPFDEFMLGLSVGDLLGKVGFFIGANRTPFLQEREGDQVVRTFDREWRLIWGAEYTF